MNCARNEILSSRTKSNVSLVYKFVAPALLFVLYPNAIAIPAFVTVLFLKNHELTQLIHCFLGKMEAYLKRCR